MLRRRNAGALLAIAATSVLLYGGTAYANPTPTPIAVELLTPRAAFTDDVAMQTSLKLHGHDTEVIKSADASRIVTQKGHAATRRADSLAHPSWTGVRHHRRG